MILTVTPSPAIDWTIDLEQLSLGEVNRGSSAAKEASGKGVNVAMALHKAGIDTAALFPAGGDSGKFMRESLSRRGLRVLSVETSFETRTNITLAIQDLGDTKVNTESEQISTDEVEKLLELFRENVSGAEMVVSCGSLPPGAPVDFHKQILAIARQAGKSCILDASGDALHSAIASAPDLIKPNIHELAELTDSTIVTLGDVEDACQSLIAVGVGSVLASMGADGAMFVDESKSVWGKVSDVQVRNTVGSGDALLAGFLASFQAGSADIASRLSKALVWAASSVESPTTFFEVNQIFETKTFVSKDFDRNHVLSSTANPGRARI